MNRYISWQDTTLLLTVNLQPRASKNEFVNTKNAPIKIRLTSSPVDNEANNHLIKFVAKEFGVTLTEVTIAKGLRNRKKLLCIKNPNKIPKQITTYIDEHQQ